MTTPVICEPTVAGAPSESLGASISRLGLRPYYIGFGGNFVLLEGDSRELLPLLTAGGITPNTIFADPPYHLSNNGITCQNGKMVSVNKGKWDASGGAQADHAFILSWLDVCVKSLARGGSIWVSGTHHVIFSVGYGLQELGAKILNTVVWEKPAPPPNLACRYFTHSHELIVWAKRSDKEKHTFNYAFEKVANGGKQQKDIWIPRSSEGDEEHLPNHWRIHAPGKKEKLSGKHPTQKPLELLDRIVRCSSNPGDLILDPFCGSGTTGLAAIGNERRFVGIDLDKTYLDLARRRAEDSESLFLQ